MPIKARLMWLRYESHHISLLSKSINRGFLAVVVVELDNGIEPLLSDYRTDALTIILIQHKPRIFTGAVRYAATLAS